MSSSLLYERAVSEVVGDLARAKDIQAFSSPEEVISDSLEMMKFLIALEEKLSISLDDDRALDLDLSSIASLTREIQSIAELR